MSSSDLSYTRNISGLILPLLEVSSFYLCIFMLNTMQCLYHQCLHLECYNKSTSRICSWYFRLTKTAHPQPAKWAPSNHKNNTVIKTHFLIWMTRRKSCVNCGPASQEMVYWGEVWSVNRLTYYTLHTQYNTDKFQHKLHNKTHYIPYNTI